MTRISNALLAAALLVPACADEPATASRTQTVSSDNALTANRLSMNRLSMNRLSMNRLSMNRLSMNRLTMNSLESEGMEADADGRELLRYVAKCALDPADILVVEHGGVEYEYPGLLNLAPEWEDRALTASEERLVSACLVAHVNAYGVSVSVSMRAPGVLLATAEETEAFPVYEGTFFGQAFADDTLRAFSCTGSKPDLAQAHAPDRELRVCADDTEDCSIVSVGRCKDVCQTRTNRYGWQNCVAEGVVYPETISVFLHDANTDGNNWFCPSGSSCYLAETTGGSAVLDGSETSYCDSDCTLGSTCSMSGADSADYFARVHDSTAEVDCGGATSCGGICQQNSDCEIDCSGAQTCLFSCASGSDCVLDCSGAEVCGFSSCSAELTYCPDDIIVCGTNCPRSFSAAGTCGDGQCTGEEDSNSCPADCQAGSQPDSCGHPSGGCGEQTPAGCWCDSQCTMYGDCCSDYEEVCDD